MRPRPDQALIRVLARAHDGNGFWRGRYCWAGELSEAEGATRGYHRLLWLTLLARPQEILDGHQPKGMQPKGMAREELTRAVPSGWEEQREVIN